MLDAHSVLARCPLFEELSPADLEALAQQAQPRSLRKGQTLFLQGDPVRSLYVVASGMIKIYRPDPKGERQMVLHLEGPLRLVAAVAVFLEKPCYPASAEALEDTELLAIPRETFFNLVDSRPPVARAMIRFLAKRQEQLVHQMDRLVFHEVEARLAEYLLERETAEGGGFRLPTNSELAALLATGPEPVSRKLGQFFREGLIEMCERRVWIKDARTLRQIAEG
jgi:CRP/FNR family transcriptional regulator